MVENNANTRTSRNKSKLKTIILCVILLFAIVGTVLGIYFGIKGVSKSVTETEETEPTKKDVKKKGKIDEQEKITSIEDEKHDVEMEKSKEEGKEKKKKQEERKSEGEEDKDKNPEEDQNLDEENKNSEEENKNSEEEDKDQNKNSEEETRLTELNNLFINEKQLRKTCNDTLRKEWLGVDYDDRYKKLPKNVLRQLIFNNYKDLQFYKDLDKINFNDLFDCRIKTLELNGYEYDVVVQNVQRIHLKTKQNKHAFTLRKVSYENMLQPFLKNIFDIQERRNIYLNGEYVACINPYKKVYEQYYLILYQKLEVAENVNVFERLVKILTAIIWCAHENYVLYNFDPNALVLCEFEGDVRLSLKNEEVYKGKHDEILEGMEHAQVVKFWQYPTKTGGVFGQVINGYQWNNAHSIKDYVKEHLRVFRYLVLKNRNLNLTYEEYEKMDEEQYYKGSNLDGVYLCEKIRELCNSDKLNTKHSFLKLLEIVKKPVAPVKNANESEGEFQIRMNNYLLESERYEKNKKVYQVKLTLEEE